MTSTSFPVTTEDGDTILIAEKKVLDASNPDTSVVLLDADGKTYRQTGPGQVEEIDAVVPEDTPAQQKADKQAELNAEIQTQQAASAEAIGTTQASKLKNPLAGDVNEDAKADKDKDNPTARQKTAAKVKRDSKKAGTAEASAANEELEAKKK
jgi:hypothetical protein